MFAVAALMAPPTLSAQAADSLAFRSGQWGTEFTLGGSYTSLGVLRFSSPSRAWIGSLSGRVEETDVGDVLPSAGLSIVNTRIGEISIGHRWYRAITQRVQQYATVGVLASASRFETESDFDLSYPLRTSAGGGVFADLGALWMVTPQLSLGAAWTANAIRSRISIEGNGPQAGETTVSRLRFGDVRVQGALYF